MERWLAWANRARQSPIILIQSRPALSNHRPAIIGMNFNPNFNSEAIFFFKVVNRKKKGKGLEWGGVCRERPNGKSTPRTISLDDSSRAASGVRRPADDESTAPATTQLRGGHRHTVLCVCVCVCVCRIFVNSHDTADCRERKTGLQRCRTACISSGRLATWQG